MSANEKKDEKLYQQSEWLKQQYSNGLNKRDISDKAGVSRQTIHNYFKKFDIDATKRDYTNDELLSILRKNKGVTCQKLDDPSNDLPTKWVFENRFGSVSRAKEIANGKVETLQCSGCGDYYKKLSRHCRETECDWSTITKEQKEILVGLLMGDGTLVNRKSDAPVVRVVNTNKQFLRWVANKLDSICFSVELENTAEEQMNKNIESGFVQTSNLENYNDVYKLYTMSHKEFKHLDWIENGEKVIPEKAPLTPTVLKMWYCSDGSLHWRNDRNKAEARITNVTENNNLQKFKRMLRNVGIDCRFSGKEIQFNEKQTKKFLNYIGEPPSGMEYKWKWRNRRLYDKKMDEK